VQGLRPFDSAQDKPRPPLRRFILPVPSSVEGSGRSRGADRVRQLADSRRRRIRRCSRELVRNAGQACGPKEVAECED
jgi:hypothetical protein